MAEHMGREMHMYWILCACHQVMESIFAENIDILMAVNCAPLSQSISFKLFVALYIGFALQRRGDVKQVRKKVPVLQLCRVIELQRNCSKLLLKI